MRARYKACILSLLVPLGLAAQDIGLLRLDPVLPERKGSASLYGGFEEGGYKPAFQASSLWKAGAGAEGVLHGARTSWSGSFSFEQMNGKGMFTSMFLEPGYFPVDVLEFTPGDKTRQTYRLEGGFATALDGDFLVLGGKASYSASNFAKRKDIRHTTYGMSLRVEPTIAFKLYDKAGLSIAYVFQKKTESIDAEQVGSATDESYYAFLDKGLRYGTYQVWDGDGLHLDEAGVGIFPVRENQNGLAYVIQLPVFSGGMELHWKHGVVGEKGYDWFRYPGHNFSLFLERKGRRQSLRLDLRVQDDQLEEAVLDKVSGGGVTTPEIYGYNAVSDRTWGSLDLTYALRFAQGHLKRLQAVLHGGLWTEKSYLMYPYTDRNDRYNASATLVAALAFGRMDIILRANGGIGRWKEQGLQGGTEDVLTTPFRLQGDWDRKMEYFATTKAGGGLTLTYHLRFLPGAWLRAEGSWLHGFGVQLLTGSDRWGSTFRIGYDF